MLNVVTNYRTVPDLPRGVVYPQVSCAMLLCQDSFVPSGTDVVLSRLHRIATVMCGMQPILTVCQGLMCSIHHHSGLT